MTESTHGAERVLAEQFGAASEEAVVASAPGRVNVLGGHTDYNGGFVLPTAIDRRTTVAARPRGGTTIDVYSIDFEDRRSVPIEELRYRDDAEWVNYVLGVVQALRDRGYAVGGTDLVVDGNVPMGAGVASSAALEVAVASALVEAHGLPVDDEELATIAWEAETEFVGVGCGIMDQFAATFCEPESALFLDCRTREFEVLPFDTEGVEILVVDTNVEHELVDSEYNERVAQCERGVEAFDRLLDRQVTSLRDVSPAEFEEHAEKLSETVRERCRHVISENERTRRAAEALRADDLETVGELMYGSHESLRDDYETSCRELDLVVELAADHDGVYGARMTGAGFGGSVVSLVRAADRPSIRSTIREEYADRTGIEPDVYACDPGDGWTAADPRTATENRQAAESSRAGAEGTGR